MKRIATTSLRVGEGWWKRSDLLFWDLGGGLEICFAVRRLLNPEGVPSSAPGSPYPGIVGVHNPINPDGVAYSLLRGGATGDRVPGRCTYATPLGLG